MRTVFVAFFILTALPQVLGATAKGYIRAQCSMTGESHLHFTRMHNRKLTRELLLAIPQQGVWRAGDEWYEYPGEGCSSDECEPAVRSKVQISRISWTSSGLFHPRRISGIYGNFEIELKNGRTLKGSFAAKLLTPSGMQCE